MFLCKRRNVKKNRLKTRVWRYKTPKKSKPENETKDNTLAHIKNDKIWQSENHTLEPGVKLFFCLRRGKRQSGWRTEEYEVEKYWRMKTRKKIEICWRGEKRRRTGYHRYWELTNQMGVCIEMRSVADRPATITLIIVKTRFDSVMHIAAFKLHTFTLLRKYSRCSKLGVDVHDFCFWLVGRKNPDCVWNLGHPDTIIESSST